MPPPTSNCGLWPFHLETDVRVASKVGNFHSKFGHTRPLGSPIICCVSDRWTKATLVAPFPVVGAIKCKSFFCYISVMLWHIKWSFGKTQKWILYCTFLWALFSTNLHFCMSACCLLLWARSHYIAFCIALCHLNDVLTLSILFTGRVEILSFMLHVFIEFVVNIAEFVLSLWDLWYNTG